ncbi:MAG: hypothetical protein ACR2J8_04940, partial [Thermomicrobiales bacterium]
MASNPVTAGDQPLLDLSGKGAHGIGERAIGAILFFCGMVSIATTIGIIVILAEQAFEFFREGPIGSFLFGSKWNALFKT